jgi:hypothetical protein
MPRIWLAEDAIHIGPRFAVTFQRTLRLPDDNRAYPLPPGLGRFPVYRVRDFWARMPAPWRRAAGFFIPVYQREALWLGFDCPAWQPRAVQIGIGGINAVTGASWREALSASPQNYLVCPDQPWLDGINLGRGLIRQFVAMPLGLGYTVEGQLTAKEERGGIQIRVCSGRPGRFPDRPPRKRAATRPAVLRSGPLPGAMGVAVGGRMRQKIYPDPYGADTWDPSTCGEVLIHLVGSAEFHVLTGRRPPPTPIDAATYTRHGLPWFELYDEQRKSLPASEPFKRVRSVRERDTERGLPSAGTGEASFEIRKTQVLTLRRSRRPGKH